MSFRTGFAIVEAILGIDPDEGWLVVDRIPSPLGIVPGSGLVARFGEIVLFLPDANGAASRLLTAVAAAAEADNPAAATVERLAPLTFGADAAKSTSFGVVAAAPEGLLVLLRGGVTAEFANADGVRTLSGERALTWVDEIVPGTVQRLAIGAGEPPDQALSHTDLRAGVAPAGGLVLGGAEPPAEQVAGSDVIGKDTVASPDAKPPAAETPHTPDRDAGRSESADARPTATMPGLPPTGSMASPMAGGRRPVPEPTSAQEPAWGTLETDDGAQYPLDRNYVIGRDPLRDPAVQSAAASPIGLPDDQHVSRVHAYVTVGGAGHQMHVLVRDAGTPGGTFIAASGAQDWTQIGTDPTELEPGWSLRIGTRVLAYRTAD